MDKILINGKLSTCGIVTFEIGDKRFDISPIDGGINIIKRGNTGGCHHMGDDQISINPTEFYEIEVM